MIKTQCQNRAETSIVIIFISFFLILSSLKDPKTLRQARGDLLSIAVASCGGEAATAILKKRLLPV